MTVWGIVDIGNKKIKQSTIGETEGEEWRLHAGIKYGNPHRHLVQSKQRVLGATAHRGCWVDLPKHSHLYTNMTIPEKKLHIEKRHCDCTTFLQHLSENIFLPALVPIMGTGTFISFLGLCSVSCEWGLLLLNNLPKVKHSMKPVVHNLNGCEKYGYHSRVDTCYHQARRKSLRGSEQTMTATETKYKNETMQSTARNECQEFIW